MGNSSGKLKVTQEQGNKQVLAESKGEAPEVAEENVVLGKENGVTEHGDVTLDQSANGHTKTENDTTIESVATTDVDPASSAVKSESKKRSKMSWLKKLSFKKERNRKSNSGSEADTPAKGKKETADKKEEEAPAVVEEGVAAGVALETPAEDVPADVLVESPPTGIHSDIPSVTVENVETLKEEPIQECAETTPVVEPASTDTVPEPTVVVEEPITNTQVAEEKPTEKDNSTLVNGTHSTEEHVDEKQDQEDHNQEESLKVVSDLCEDMQSLEVNP